MIKNTITSILSIIFLFPATGLHTQERHVDSLRIETYYGRLGQHCYTNLDSTLYYLDLLLQDTRQLGWTEEESYAYLWGILCTGYHDQIDLKYELLSQAGALLAEKGAALEAEVLDAIDLDLRMHWGDYYMETGGYNGALEIYEDLAMALKAEEELSDEAFQRLVITHQYLATIHRLRGSYREAIDYSFQALDYERKYYASRGEKGGDESLAYGRIANAYWLIGEKAKALGYYRPAFEKVRSTYDEDPNGRRRLRKHLISMGQELGRYYRELSQADSALYFLESVAPYTLPEDPITQELRLEKARVWQLKGNFAQALDTLQRSITQLEQNPEKSNNFLIGKMYNGLADIFTAQRSYPDALKAYQQALRYFSEDFDSDDLLQNPPIHTGQAPREMLYALTQKTRLLSLHPPGQSEEWLQAAWTTAQAGMDLVDSIKLSYTSDYDKQYLLGDSYILYELALQIIHRMGEDQALTAFNIMERSKAVVLQAAVRDLHARTYANVPEEELEKVRRLQYQLAEADAQLEQALTEDQQIAGRKTKLELKQQYDALVRSFEKNYPAYYQLKYGRNAIELSDVALPDDQLLIEYFIGNDHLYVFAYCDDGTPPKLLQLPWDEKLSEWASELKNDVYRQNDTVFSERAYALYQALLEPVLAQNHSPKRLLLIPDGVLGYLPFDILLTERLPAGSSANFRDYPFLLRKMAVSQSFSYGMLREMQLEQDREGDELLAFAPSFPGANVLAERSDRDVLGELFYNEEEAAAVLEAFEGRMIADRQATKDQFLELASRYRIYHIASHAVVDDERPNHSFIAFAPAADQEVSYSRLYSYEILAQSFPAELVVLSACETGIGKVVRGEGIMSLARAFSYAGARSLVTSLWNVNDQSGRSLMGDFYQQLSSGLTKDEALRQAKLAYLQKAPDNARTHPRYWAAFIPTGNMEPLGSSRSWHWAIPALLLLGLLVLFALRKRSSS